MPRIPFPQGTVGTENLPRTRRSLQNCFYNGENRIIGRPGITSIKNIAGVARGSFEWNGSLYNIKSQELQKFTDLSDGTYSVNANAIAGPEPCQTAIGFNSAVIVVQGGAIYSLDTSDTLTTISGNSNFVPCVDVCHINGRFVYIPADGSPAFFSDVGAAGTVQAASFFDAENLPDKNNACFNLKETLYIMGTDSIQLFRNVATSAANPFLPVQGSRILNGYIGGLLEYNNTFLFIGRETNQDRGIYAIGQGNAPKISNEYIDLILAGYTDTELSECVSGRLKWRGYDLATFTLARHSFGFYGGNWFLLDTVESGISRPWFAGYITEINGTYYTNYTEKFGKFAKVSTDYGNAITRIIDTALEQENNEYFRCQSIELGISQGYNTSSGSVGLMLSNDNVTYGPAMFRNLGSIGQYDMKLDWNYPGGLGNYEGFMGMRFYTTDDIDFSADHLIANTL